MHGLTPNSGFLDSCVERENEDINHVCKNMCMSLDCVTSDIGDPKHVMPPFQSRCLHLKVRSKLRSLSAQSIHDFTVFPIHFLEDSDVRNSKAPSLEF